MKFLANAAALAALSGTAAVHASPTAATNPLGAPLAPRGEKVSYDNYHIYRLRAETPRDVQALEARFATYHTVHAARDGLDIAIPPHEVRDFEASDVGLTARLIHDDLGSQIRAEAASSSASKYRRDLRKRGELPDLSWFEGYHEYEEHLAFWEDLHAAFPDNSEKIHLGESYEGRDLEAYHLFGDEGVSGEKPIVLWHGTVHAREWITTATVEYLTYQLIDGYKSGDANVTNFLNHYDFWIVPFHNPDGFAYTKTNDRMWRKNRQPRTNATCIGTDNNRNWNYQWYFEPEGGSVSPDPCAQSFKGRCPGDTPENQALSALSDELAATGPGIRSYIDWHSYSQLILLPWGWSCEPEDLPETLPRMREVGEGTAAAIFAEEGEEYVVGPSCEVLYYSAGTGRDHHHGALNATHSWSLELRPASAGAGGFILPPEQILPTAREQWAGQLYLLNEVWDEE